MKTVLLGPPPLEVEALIARRRALGHDLHDEVVDPRLRSVAWFRRGSSVFEAAPASELLGTTADELADVIDW